MNKLTSVDISTLANTDYDIKVDTGPTYTGGGLLDQIYASDYPNIFAVQMPFTVIETGEYSMIVKEVYKEYKILDVKGNKVVESIESPEGTIVYFSDKLPEELKYYNVIYANVEKVLNYNWVKEFLESQFTWQPPAIGGGRNIKIKNNNGQSK